jgi:glycosyltransferase involved in cell wall biosynthesis
MSETGVVALPEVAREWPPEGMWRILFVGRLTRSKGVRDAIRALGRLGAGLRWHFDVLGEGEDRGACEREARELGIAERTTFHGRVPRETVAEFYARAHLFLFPSFREPSGNAVLEAMSYGLPLIVAQRGGPSHAVTPECGMQVMPENPEQYAEALASALREMLAEPRRLRQMGLAARERIGAMFLWDRKIEQVSRWYAEVAAGARGTGACEGAARVIGNEIHAA